jgi:hypothetical protein
LFTSDEIGDYQIAILDGDGDTVRSRIPLGPNWLVAMCYDDVNDLVWCAMEVELGIRLLAIDGTTDIVVDSVLLEGPCCAIGLCFAREDNKLYVVHNHDPEYVLTKAAPVRYSSRGKHCCMVSGMQPSLTSPADGF